MNTNEMFSHIDHTQLKPFATWEDIRKLCEEAIKYNTASVCIPPTYIKRIHDTYGDKINICTVVGFPLGYSVTSAKISEVKQAILDGCNEIDMVIDITDVKNGDFEKVEEEIRTLKKECGNHILKVIIETCFLTKEEKIYMCHAVTNAGADYIKTSTGFGTAGATLEDIKLMKENIGSMVKIKAAGGVKTIADLSAFLEAGADRIGTSSAVSLINQEQAKDY
jgi:deoxyribose-phosphate aldolase